MQLRWGRCEEWTPGLPDFSSAGWRHIIEKERRTQTGCETETERVQQYSVRVICALQYSEGEQDCWSAALTRDGESAKPPTEAFSSSIDGGTHLALSDTSGLILILNFFLLSSSSSESLEEKNCFPLEAGGHASRTKYSRWCEKLRLNQSEYLFRFS